MKRIRRTRVWCALAVFTVSAWGGALFSQDGETRQLTLLVVETKVKPSNSVAYEAALKEVLRAVRNRNLETVNFFTLQRDDFTYNHVAQVEASGHPDPQSKFWSDLERELGTTEANRLKSGFDGLIESSKASYLHRRFDLSYEPENVSASTEPMPVIHTDWFYFELGSFDEAIALAKEFKALWRANQVERSYRLYFGGVGMERPMMLVAQNARSESDYYRHVEKRNAAIGEAPLNNLLQRFWAITKKFEHYNGTLRPDLSHGEPVEVLSAK